MSRATPPPEDARKLTRDTRDTRDTHVAHVTRVTHIARKLTRRAAVPVLALVLVVTAVVTLGVVLLLGDDTEEIAAQRARLEARAAGSPSAPVLYDEELERGDCFDHPALSHGVTRVERRSCERAHDGEVIAEEKLRGSFKTAAKLREKALALCGADAARRMKSIPQDGRGYHYYAIYPSLRTHSEQGASTSSCALTLRSGREGPKLTAPLPGGSATP
ncbi:hypothetical protein [Streptomyces daliensis]|uniref:Septum formation-related domain-containing protein n=1 Tax=Streptomyces daliensis TaxID=299421 RepID=A0A8T4IHV3_9ACTN|nr:hypothetical protein [Streptomyces daliensis]